MNQVIAAAPLIQASGLTKHYPGFSLAGVNVTVEPGQVVGFVGKNGSGKSTTIKPCWASSLWTPARQAFWAARPVILRTRHPPGQKSR